MIFPKNFRRLAFFICMCLLVFVFISLFLALPKFIASHLLSPINVTSNIEENHTKQDDQSLIDLIKNELIRPATPDSTLNFSKPIWKSPVAGVVMRVLNNKTNGFFVECGAFNGEWLSNSIELEEYFKWSGLLVEADPYYQMELVAKNRKSWILPACLSPKPYPMMITMQRHKEWAALSNIPELQQGSVEPGEFPFKFEVQCFPLYSILLALNKNVVDYLSLDVESAEWSILQTIPFDKIIIKVISMEMSRNFVNSTEYLLSLGYRQHAIVKAPFVHDAIFVHKTVST